MTWYTTKLSHDCSWHSISDYGLINDLYHLDPALALLKFLSLWDNYSLIINDAYFENRTIWFGFTAFLLHFMKKLSKSLEAGLSLNTTPVSIKFYDEINGAVTRIRRWRNDCSDDESKRRRGRSGRRGHTPIGSLKAVSSLLMEITIYIFVKVLAIKMCL